MAINGVIYDWESVDIQLPNGVAVGATDISYNDERGIEAIYGKGSLPRGYGRKNYKATGSMTLDLDEAEALRSAMDGKVYSSAPFVIVVSFANDDQPTVTDTLPACLITKRDRGASQDSEKAGETKFDFICLEPIQTNGEAAI